MTDIAPFPGGAVPEQRPNFVPATGCPYPQIWSPKAAACVPTPRLTSTAPDANRVFTIGAQILSWIPSSAGGSSTANGGSAGANGKSASGSTGSFVGLVSLFVVSISFLYAFMN